MVQLIGNLTGIGLPRLVQFLTDLRVSGRLCIAIEPGVSGTVFLKDGTIIGARLDDNEAGLVALEALVLVSSNASFAFSDSSAPLEHNLNAEPTALQEHLDHLGNEGPRLMSHIGSLIAEPRLVTAYEPDAAASITVSRRALRLLVDIHGEITVLDLARRYGLRTTLERLHELITVGLVSVGECPSESAPAAARELAHAETWIANHPAAGGTHDFHERKT